MGFEFLLANHAVSAETEEGGGRKGSREAVEAAVRRPPRFSSWVQLSGFLYFLFPHIDAFGCEQWQLPTRL